MSASAFAPVSPVFRWLSVLVLVVAGAPALTAGRAAAAGLAPPPVPSSGAYFGSSGTPRGTESRQDAITHIENQVGRKLAIDHQFYRWDDTLPTAHQTWDINNGRIPFVSWKPQTRSGTPIPWTDIAGGRHDSWIAAQADRVRNFSHPVFMVFNHEPYDQSKGGWGSSADFVAAWRHIVDTFRSRGATNVAWTLILTGYDYKVAGRADAFYPGDTYVDWIGADPYNFLTRDGVWRELSEVAGDFTAWATPRNKPLMLGEWGSEEDPARPGRKAQWFQNATNWLKTQPAVKAVVYFNSNIVYQWWIDTSTTSLAAFTVMSHDPWFNPTAEAVPPPPPPLPDLRVGTPSGGGTPLVPAVGGLLPAAPKTSGYWIVDAGGGVHAFGGVTHHGSPSGAAGAPPAVDIEATPGAGGYWVVDDRGRVHAYGDAGDLGSLGARTLRRDEGVTSLSRTPSGKGYWIFTSQGRVFAFGDAAPLGDLSTVKLNAPVLDSVATPSGAGYFMVAADGGVFSFGDARFGGSMGGRSLNAPVRSLVPDADGHGYWLVAADGGVFAFDAPFLGSMGGVRLNRPVSGMVRMGGGYLMVGEDGGIFNFSSRPFTGSLGDRPPSRPVVSVAAAG